MKYETVVEEMIEGKKAKLPEWSGYLYMNDKNRIMHKYGKMSIPARDYLRMDWEVCQEEKKEPCIECPYCHNNIKVKRD